jgi:uncharacterized protein (TIRG00374 family)
VNKQTTRYLITALKFAMSIAILAYLFNTARKNDQFDLLFSTKKQWGWIAIAFAACVGAHLVGFLRWRMMVRALDLPFSIADAIRIGFIGSFFNLFAFGVIGGDTLRAFYVTRQIHNRTPEAISSVVADRMIGLLTMFLVASIAFLLLDMSAIESEHPKKLATLQYACRTVFAVTMLGFATLIALFFTPALAKTGWYQSMMTIPKLGPIISRITSVVTMYRSRPGVVLVSFVMSLGVNLCFVLAIYAIAAGLTGSYPSLRNHFLIEPISMVSNAVPLPGGLGGMELALNFLYEAFSCQTGVIVAFTFRFALLSVSAIGAAFWFLNRSKVSDAMETGAQQPESAHSPES